MLRKYSNSRNLKDNIQLGALTAFSAGMANIASLLIFFAFSSNITGYYAVLAAELMKGNFYNAASVMLWIFTFFIGSFLSNFIVIHFNRVNAYVAHAAPIVIEILCLLIVGIYGQFFYQETLTETKALITLMILAMGLQNGLTASISNFAVKTTHLTGASTDMAILMSMFTKAEYRNNTELTGKASLLGAIFLSYLVGAAFAGLLYFKIGFGVFYVISFVLIVVIFYDYSKLRVKKITRSFSQELQV
jgi:uncharacterized membrane protein YoaK (UPF0700 family)